MGKSAQDPRTIITPDAFSIDPPLLGVPLANPSRRAWALFLDLIAVFMITASTASFWFILPFIAGFFFLSRAFQRGPRTRFGRVRRFFLGCLGIFVLGSAGSIYVLVRFLSEGPEIESSFEISRAVDDDEITDDSVAMLGADGASPSQEPQSDEEDAEQTPATPVEDLSLDEAMSEYTAWRGLDPDERDRRRGRQLRRRIQLDVASDTIDELLDEVEDLRDDLQAAKDRAADAESGFGSWLRSKLDTFGFGLGWWTMYFAILMPWMNGATPGKRIMGIRVVRLDGQPMTWWHAFERAGGYAAGLATGLLGFAQIFWDPNRQGIHDKVAGTVVVMAGAQPVPGRWESVVEKEQERMDQSIDEGSDT